jgi:hypothetical protein
MLANPDIGVTQIAPTPILVAISPCRSLAARVSGLAQRFQRRAGGDLGEPDLGRTGRGSAWKRLQSLSAYAR